MKNETQTFSRAKRGYCQCGCGASVGFWTANNTSKGWVKGEPKAFVKGHQQRINAIPFRRKTLEQRQIVLKILGRPLPKGALVHHVNEIKSDNRHCNLVICQDTAYHALLHRRMKAKAACGNADWERCSICKQWGPPTEVTRKKSHPYHRKCAAEFRKSSPSYPWKVRTPKRDYRPYF